MRTLYLVLFNYTDVKIGRLAKFQNLSEDDTLKD